MLVAICQKQTGDVTGYIRSISWFYGLLRSISLEEVRRGHVNMLETLAGRIAQRVLALDGVQCVRVRVDKPNIFPDCDGVGIEVEQRRACVARSC